MATATEQRELTFQNLDEVVAEVERLASGEVETSGDHTFAEIVEHLSIAHDMCTGKIQAPSPPFMMRLMMPLIRMSVINNKPLKAGVKLPAAAEAFFWPTKQQNLDDAVAHLKESVAEYNSRGALPKHPFFGKMTPEQNLSLNLRHAALHLGFVHPK